MQLVDDLNVQDMDISFEEDNLHVEDMDMSSEDDAMSLEDDLDIQEIGGIREVQLGYHPGPFEEPDPQLDVEGQRQPSPVLEVQQEPIPELLEGSDDEGEYFDLLQHRPESPGRRTPTPPPRSPSPPPARPPTPPRLDGEYKCIHSQKSLKAVTT